VSALVIIWAETRIVDGIDILRLKPGPSANDHRVNREQNILDAVSLPVNRLAFKRILSAGWQSDVGGLTGQFSKRVMYLPPLRD
jgi:hypothetical protein